MACITILAPPLAMATTQLTRETVREVSAPAHFEPNSERQPLRMNWVVVTGKNGTRHLRAQWTADQSRLNL
jgi:hypothetical protein